MTQNRELEIHDALERLTYAHLQQDSESVARAERKLESALSEPSPVSAKRAQQMLVRMDPVSAVAMGLLSLTAARRKIRQNPNDFLDEEEATAFKRDSTVLRYIVQARETGKTLSEVLVDIDRYKQPNSRSAVNKRKRTGENRRKKMRNLRKKSLASRLLSSRR